MLIGTTPSPSFTLILSLMVIWLVESSIVPTPCALYIDTFIIELIIDTVNQNKNSL